MSHGSTKDSRYAVTEMIRGDFRAECHYEGCWWWCDYETRKVALRSLRIHMVRQHRVDATDRRALA